MTLRPALLLAALLACTAPPPPPDANPAPAGPPPQPITVTVTVHADAPGASPTVVERTVTTPLELALASAENLTAVRSTSRDEHAELTLTFAPGTAPSAARQAVMTHLQAAQSSLPDGTSPSLGPDRDPHTAVLFTLQSTQVSVDELGRIASSVRESLLKIPGVVDVAMCGHREPRVEISLDPARLTAYGLAANTVVDAVRRELDSLSLGTGIRTAPAARSPEELGAIAVAAREAPIRLSDLATITATAAIATCDAVRLTAGPAVVALVHARRGTTPDEFNKAIRAGLDTQRADLRVRGIDLDIPAHVLRLAVDLDPPADPPSLAIHADRIHKLLAAADLRSLAYLQATIPGLPGVRFTGELFVVPTSADEAAKLRETLPRLADLGLGAIGSLADPEDDPQRHRVWVTGPDLETDAHLALRLTDLLRDVSGVARVHYHDERNPELLVELERDRLAALGLRPADVQTALALVLDGVRVGTILSGADTTAVHVRLPAGNHLERTAQLQTLTLLPASGGAAVPLQTLVKISLTLAPREILHNNHQRAVPVDYFFTNPLTAKSAQDRIARDLNLPPGLSLVWE